MRLRPNEIEAVAALIAGHTWTSSVDLAGMSSVEASALRGLLPITLDDRDRLHNRRGFARWLLRQAFYEPTRPVRTSRYSKPRGAKGRGLDVAAVRAWAAEKGLPCNSHGPIRQTLIDAYLFHHPTPTQETTHE